MDFEKIEIDLNNEELELIEEIKRLQEEKGKIDPKKTNRDLLDSLKNAAIESISMSLGISDILENRAHNTGFDFEKEYKRYQEWESKPITERAKNYKSKYVPDSEFNTMMENSKNIQYNRNNLTGEAFKESQKSFRKKNPDGVNSMYTGKNMKHGDACDYEHVMSVHEVAMNPVLNRFLDNSEKKDFLHSKENFGAVERNINISKNNIKVKDLNKWLEKQSKKDPSKSNAEYFEIDKQKFNSAIEDVVKKKEELLASKTTNYDLKTKGKIALKNAAKGATKAVMGKLLSITVVEIINEFQTEGKSELSEKIKNISKRIKNKSNDLLNTFKDHSINTFISTLLDAILNSLFKIAKNIYKFVKSAFMSILKAIKILFSSEYSREARLKEALKILGATVATLIGIALDEIIEKALVSAFPLTATFAGYLSPVLSGLIVGIGSVLLIQGFQKYQNNIEFMKLQNMENSNTDKMSKVNLALAGISDIKTTESIIKSIFIFDITMPLIASFHNSIEENLTKIKTSNLLIASTIEETKSEKSEIEDLLNQLENI